VIALAYFGFVGRNRLVLSPEEEFAMTRGIHGHPEREGYGVTEREELRAPAGAEAPGATTRPGEGPAS
jgi:ethanolamine permease